jgi:L-alanine-DL-glutamate epimerase-like enolase superfamily enzyme
LFSQVDVIDIALPLRREWRWRGLHEQLGRWSIVRLETDEGVVGWGEATALRDWGGDFGRYAGETQATVRHVIEDILAPLVRTADPFDVEATLLRFDEAIRGHVYAKAAVEMALHDVQGKIVGLPLHKLLGGAVREGVAIAHMIGIMGIEEAVEEALAAQADGVTALQLKGSGELSRDLALVERVRGAVGDDVVLRVDANQGYRRCGAKEAIQAVSALEAAGANLVEQPTEGLRAMAAIRKAVSVTILADESCWRPEDVLDLAAAGAADAISIYLAKAGGISRARKVAAVAEAHGFPCDVNGSLESGIGNAANVHFAVASPPVTLACVIPVSVPAGGEGPAFAGRYYSDDLTTEPLRFVDGRLQPPDGPGLGIAVDEEKLAAFRIR